MIADPGHHTPGSCASTYSSEDCNEHRASVSIHCAASCAVPCFTWYKTISSKKHPNSSLRINDALHVQSLGNFCFIVGCFPSRRCTGAGRLWVCPLARGVRFLAKISVQSLVTLAPHFSTASPESIWTHKNLIWRSRPPFFFRFQEQNVCGIWKRSEIFFSNAAQSFVDCSEKFCFESSETKRIIWNCFKKA